MNFKAGDKVRFVKMPDWVDTMGDESKKVFHHCFGKVYPIDKVEEEGSVYVLDVNDDVDEVFGGYMNDIRLEEEYLEKVEE